MAARPLCRRLGTARGVRTVLLAVAPFGLLMPLAAPGPRIALYLLLTTRGRDYSFDEVSQWLGDAGFVDIRLETLPSPPFTSSMVLARKP